LVLFYYAFFLFKKEQNLSEKGKKALIEYEKTLEAASKKAQNILEHTNIISEELKESYEKVFQNISISVEKTTEDFLRRVLIDQGIVLTNFTKKAISKYEELFDKTIKDSGDSYLKQQKDLDSAIKAKTNELTLEIEEYKNSRIVEIDKIIKSEIDVIITKSLPKYISIENKEQLVLDALNKAHEDGFFNRL
jgi:hypothetical protein